MAAGNLRSPSAVLSGVVIWPICMLMRTLLEVSGLVTLEGICGGGALHPDNSASLPCLEYIGVDTVIQSPAVDCAMTWPAGSSRGEPGSMEVASIACIACTWGVTWPQLAVELCGLTELAFGWIQEAGLGGS